MADRPTTCPTVKIGASYVRTDSLLEWLDSIGPSIIDEHVRQQTWINPFMPAYSKSCWSEMRDRIDLDPLTNKPRT